MRNPSLILLIAGLAAGGAAEAQDGAPARSLEETRATLAKWVETRQIISKEREEWLLAKEVLEQRIAVVQREIAALESKIAEARSNLAEAEERRSEIVEDQSRMTSASRSLRETIGRLEAKTLALTDSLPPPIADRVAPLTRRIPRDPAATSSGLGERFQNVIGILNEVDKFNREVTVTSELRSLASGGSAEVQTLYLGLGQAYYVTPNGDAAGIGRPTKGGWEWIEANHLAAAVTRAIAILNNQQVPAYVPLPVEIR